MVAPRLIGAEISTAIDDKRVAVKITEVEAYGGLSDPASHAYRSRTARNDPMFRAPGTIYVYLSYGIHWCVNLVAGPENVPHAVLIRGGTVVDGAQTVVERRGRTDHLADGPGKLCQALAIDGSMSGSRLQDGPVSFALPAHEVLAVKATPRVGISKAKDRLWRFVEDTA